MPVGVMRTVVATLVLLAIVISPANGATTYTVNSTGDDGDATAGDGACETATGNGVCTLRAALEEVDAGTGGDAIHFNIDDATDSGCNAATHDCMIRLGGELPSIFQPVSIDGSTQPGSSCGDLWSGTAPIWHILITSGGSAAYSGLSIDGDQSTVRGLAITGFAPGLDISCSGLSVTCARLYGNVDGLRAHGAAHLIGGPSAGDGNLVSANQNDGIVIVDATGVTIQGNFVGTNAAGTAADGNAGNGITLVGSSTCTVGGTGAREKNLSSANGNGIRMEDSPETQHHATDNTVIGNYVGADITGATTLCNGNDIVDGGVNTTLSDNIVCPVMVGCCAFQGDSGVTCVDDTFPGVRVTDTSYCQALSDTYLHGDTALYANRSSNCSTPGDLQSQCVPEGEATATPLPTTPTVTALPTASATPTADATATPTPIPCLGDCDGSRTVTVDELVRGVSIALGTLSLSACPTFDQNGDREVSVSELINAVNNALDGCPASLRPGLRATRMRL